MTTVGTLDRGHEGWVTVTFPAAKTAVAIALRSLVLVAIATVTSAVAIGAPAQPSPELQRLVGKWIALTRCGPAERRELPPQQLVLTVHDDATKASGISAEVRGLDRTAGVALDVTLDPGNQQYRLTPAGWLPTGGGHKEKPYGLVLSFLEERELLYGEVTGRSDCQTVVAGKLPSEDAPPNPDGLLYKIAGKRMLEPLTETDCAAYADWLADGETFQVYGSSAWFNQAVSDGAAMRRVLGHDLELWTEEDARKIGVIHSACHRLLQASVDPAVIELANHERIWKGIASPLRYSKSKYPGFWGDTYFALNRLLVANILEARQLIDEGLFAQSAEGTPPATSDETGLAGEWRGYYRCGGGNEVFMRLTFAGANPLDVRFEFGPSLKTMHPLGALSMSGTFDRASRRITLEPRDWIQQPRGQVRPLGFEGHLDERGDVIEGDLRGNPDCPHFSVTRREVAHEPVNPDGLLFKYLQRGMISATAEDCRAYAEWLAAGEETTLGKSSYFSGLRSSGQMRAVLGKDLNQWDDSDSGKMLPLARHCEALLEKQVDPEISALLARIAEKRLVWVPRPLGAPRAGNTLSLWLAAEQVVMVNEQQQALVARKLAEANTMPPEIGSIDSIDALGKEADKGLRGPLGYLSEQELDAYFVGLRAARVKVGIATAGAAAASWTRRARTYVDLEAVEADYQKVRKQFESRKSPQGIEALDVAFRRESGERSNALWPGVLQTTLSELHTLSDADLTRFPELTDDQERQAYLARFRVPGDGDPYFESYRSADALYRGTVEWMVKRSEPQLLEWIGSLPPSIGANELLDRFSGEVFAVSTIPDRHPALQQAAAAKKGSYNPDGYIRPDIVMSLRRGQWNEVGLVGLEDLAYAATSLREIKNFCPGVVPEESGPLTSFFLDLSQQAVARIMQGEVQSKQEAERAFFLFMNNVVNQPGCRVDYFGTVVGCVSAQDHAAAQEFLLTSGDAQSDTQVLVRSGCGREGAQSYVQGLLAYARAGQYAPPAQVARDFWTWTGASNPAP